MKIQQSSKRGIRTAKSNVCRFKWLSVVVNDRKKKKNHSRW